MRALLFSAGVALLASGCVHSLNDVYVGDVSEGTYLAKARAVEARSEQFAVLGFVYNTDYVEAARHDLLSQCDGGRIEGITTQSSTDLGFLSWTNRLLMKGYCVHT